MNQMFCNTWKARNQSSLENTIHKCVPHYTSFFCMRGKYSCISCADATEDVRCGIKDISCTFADSKKSLLQGGHSLQLTFRDTHHDARFIVGWIIIRIQYLWNCCSLSMPSFLVPRFYTGQNEKKLSQFSVAALPEICLPIRPGYAWKGWRRRLWTSRRPKPLGLCRKVTQISTIQTSASNLISKHVCHDKALNCALWSYWRECQWWCESDESPGLAFQRNRKFAAAAAGKLEYTIKFLQCGFERKKKRKEKKKKSVSFCFVAHLKFYLFYLILFYFYIWKGMHTTNESWMTSNFGKRFSYQKS